MEFKVGGIYKTRGGWKAVVVKISDGETFAWHGNTHNTTRHKLSGRQYSESTDRDLVSEWQEPIKRTFYFTTNGKLFTVNSSLQEAENHIKNAVDWEIFQLDYVLGATHYVAKGE